MTLPGMLCIWDFMVVYGPGKPLKGFYKSSNILGIRIFIEATNSSVHSPLMLKEIKFKKSEQFQMVQLKDEPEVEIHQQGEEVGIWMILESGLRGRGDCLVKEGGKSTLSPWLLTLLDNCKGVSFVEVRNTGRQVRSEKKCWVLQIVIFKMSVKIKDSNT